jgi:cellulose synthase/poly-beta-1,6-N-acetylglucosamine synthase-like glycosyltransferase
MPSISAILAVPLLLADLLALVYVAYRTFLGLLAMRKVRTVDLGPGKTKFLILIPSRDEQDVIADTVRCIQALDYPEENRLIYVVADNCVDATVDQAVAAGANVLAKSEPSIGKGSVIQWALARPEIKKAKWDAVIFFDADSRPNDDFLRLTEGALGHGDRAIQARSESHPQKGWVPTAYAMNTTQRNRNWHQARESAGFSAALTGTGMCLTRELLHAFPPEMHTLTEDLEYGARLTAEGIRVRYLYQAVTIIDQPPTFKASVGQRLRWARGQLITAFVLMPRMMWRSIRHLDLSMFDTALYLLLPSIVPLQAYLLVSMFGHILPGGVWPGASATGLIDIPVIAFVIVLALSLIMPSVGLHAEGRRYHFRDWVAFVLLMLTWIVIAIVAALTTWVGTWHRTPRTESYGKPATENEAVGHGGPAQVRARD